MQSYVMGSPPLSPETEYRIATLFPAEQRVAVRNLLLLECGNNLMPHTPLDSAAMDRFRFAALKLSGGDWKKLQAAVQLAQQDWRDLLMAAGFGHDPEAHRTWQP
jgi:hypothetical protein